MGRYNSFIVRVWTDGNGRLRGKIEHVTTHESLIFLELEPIVGFIRSRLARGADAAAVPDDESMPPSAPGQAGANGMAAFPEGLSLDGTAIQNVPHIDSSDEAWIVDLGSSLPEISPEQKTLFDLSDNDAQSFDEKPPA